MLSVTGQIIGSLPGILGTVKAASKLIQTMKLSPKAVNAVGLATHGVLEGIAEDEELSKILLRGGTGGLMGSMGAIVSKLRPKYLQMP